MDTGNRRRVVSVLQSDFQLGRQLHHHRRALHAALPAEIFQIAASGRSDRTTFRSAESIPVTVRTIPACSDGSELTFVARQKRKERQIIRSDARIYRHGFRPGPTHGVSECSTASPDRRRRRKADAATYVRNRKPIAEWRYEQSRAFSSKKEPSPKHPDTQRAP